MSTIPRSEAQLTRPEVSEMVRETPPSGKKRSLVFMAVVVTLGSFLFGYDTGVIAGALPFMYMPMQAGGLDLLPWEEGLVGGLLAIGAAFGAIIGGQLSDRYGRRHNIIILAIIFIVGTLGNVLAPNVWILYPFRFILGWAVGGASSTVPIYLAETAPKRIRGTLVAVDQFMIVFGQLVAYSMNAWLSHANGGPRVTIEGTQDSVAWDSVANNIDAVAAVTGGNGMTWRYMLVLATIPAILLWLGMHMMPETARWYGAKERYFEAIGALKRIRQEDRDDVEQEIWEIVEVNEASKDEEHWRFKQIVQTKWTRKVLIIGIFIGFFDQLTGINTAMYYLPKILNAAGFNMADSIMLNVITGLASAIGAGVGLYFVYRFARRHVAIYQETGIVIALFSLALIFGFGIAPHMDASGNITSAIPAILPWLVLLLVAIFVFVKQSGTVAWILVSEIFPSRIRGVAQGMAVGGLWIMNAVVTFAFPVMISGLGPAWTYAIFGLINVAALLFYIKIVPETKGYSLEEIEERLEAKYS